jgi:N6-L-threonylcarbamoyladenine synthase
LISSGRWLKWSMITLGIETSCDETGIGIIDRGRILANLTASQIVHTRYGGVVPELAARNHIKSIMPLIRVGLEVAGIKLAGIELVAATNGPGLIGALLVGLSFAKSLAIALKKPFVAVNHLEGHVYALRFDGRRPRYPYLVLLVSGGHTELVLIRKEFAYESLARTADDACGEAFDKVAKLIGLPYPGGPYIEKAARSGRVGAVKFPVPRPKRLGFSYSGLKTAVLYYLRDHPGGNPDDIAANFQEAALDHLTAVTRQALKQTGVRYLGIVGGVSGNTRLHEKFRGLAREFAVTLLIPGLQYCTDNGAMIARAGAARYKKYGASDINVDAVARQSLEELET